MLNRNINSNFPITNHDISHLDTLEFFDLDLLSRNRQKFPKDILNIIFEYAEDEKLIKIKETTDIMADHLTGNYNFVSYHFPLNTGGSVKITKDVANQKSPLHDIVCTLEFRVSEIIRRGRGHGMVVGGPIPMFYQTYMGPYQILGHILNTPTHLKNNSWIRRLIKISGYNNIDEFIYYSQHCNLWECNEQNMWIPTNKKMMIYNRQKNNQEQDAHNYMNNLNKNLEQIYSTEDRRITLEDLEMNQLRSRFEEELELLGEFTRVIGREINVEPNREYIFTDRILGYLRELRTRYSGLSIREIIDREINSSLILEQSSSFIPGRNGQEPYPLIIHQIHFQGLIEHSVNMIRSSQWPRAQQTIPRRTGDERREYYFRRSRLFNEQEQELGIIMAFFELHLDRLDLLNRLTRRGHRIRNIRFDGNIPWADLWIRLRNRPRRLDRRNRPRRLDRRGMGDEIFRHADIWRDFIRNELNRVDHFNVRLPNPDDEAEGVN